MAGSVLAIKGEGAVCHGCALVNWWVYSHACCAGTRV